jgi:hypothetical protein
LAGLQPLDLYRRMYQRYVRPSAAVKAAVDQFRADKLGAQPALAVHFRTQSGGKIAGETVEKRALTTEEYFDAVDRVLAGNSAMKLYLMTDYEPATALFRGRYGERVVWREGNIRLPSTEVPDLQQDDSHDGTRLGQEVTTDVFVAAGCQAFIGDGASHVSSAVYFLNDWTSERASLLRQPVLLTPGRQEILFS